MALVVDERSHVRHGGAGFVLDGDGHRRSGLDIGSRGWRLLEDQGLLAFFNVSPKLRRTTKPLLDQLLHTSLMKELEELEQT